MGGKSLGKAPHLRFCMGLIFDSTFKEDRGEDVAGVLFDDELRYSGQGLLQLLGIPPSRG